MAVATEQLTLILLTADGLVRCRASEHLEGLEALGTALEGENVREVCQDPFNPRRFYAASTAGVYLSEDGGESWEQLATGGVNFREIWTMAAHPTRPNVVYIGTMPAMVGRQRERRPVVPRTGELPRPTGLRALDLPVAAAQPDHSRHYARRASAGRAPGRDRGGRAGAQPRWWGHVGGHHRAVERDHLPARQGRERPDAPGAGAARARAGLPRRALDRPPSHQLDTIYVTTGQGLYRSQDGARSWTRLDAGRDRGYMVQLALANAAPERLFIGAAENGPPAGRLSARRARAPSTPGASARISPTSSAGPGRRSGAATTAEIPGASWAAGCPGSRRTWSARYASIPTTRHRSSRATRTAASTTAQTRRHLAAGQPDLSEAVRGPGLRPGVSKPAARDRLGGEVAPRRRASRAPAAPAGAEHAELAIAPGPGERCCGHATGAHRLHAGHSAAGSERRQRARGRRDDRRRRVVRGRQCAGLPEMAPPPRLPAPALRAVSCSRRRCRCG